MLNLTGQCACANVQYEILDEPLVTQICHCKDCQRTTGSAFVIHIVLCEMDLKISGQTEMSLGPSGSGAGCELHRCANCGVIIWVRYRYHRVPVIAVRAGTLIDPSQVKPAAQIFVDSKRAWLGVSPDIPAYSKGAERSEFWPAESIKRYDTLPLRLS